jgi:hypothetical protein
MANANWMLVSAAFLSGACGANSSHTGGKVESEPSRGGGSSTSGGNASTTSGGTAAAGGSTSSSGGSPAAGGSTATGGSSSSGGDGGTGPILPPTCANPSSGLPADAPALTPGVWTYIQVGDVDFDINDTQPNGFVHANTLVSDRCNRATLYAAIDFEHGGEGQGIWRSTNAGTSWTHLAALNGLPHMAVDPGDPLHLYAVSGVIGSAQGIWVSHDGGFTWETPAGFQAAWEIIRTMDMYYLATDPTDFNHVLFTFHSGWDHTSNAGILETHDGGDSFTIHQPQWGGHGQWIEYLYDVENGIGDSSTWLLGVQNEGYYRTSNAGTSWTKVTGPVAVDVVSTHGGGQLYRGANGTVYVTGNNSCIKSTDNGITWTKIGPTGGFLAIAGNGEDIYSTTDQSKVIYTASESNDTSWGPDPNGPALRNGGFHMSVDEENGIIYAAAMQTGFWALKAE